MTKKLGMKVQPWHVAPLATVVFFTTTALPASVLAADATTTTSGEELKEIVVTGSLIPQLKTETSTPVVTITAEEITAKGFVSVADALQHSSFSTGGVQGPQFSAGFTPGAQTLSLFGLSPSYTKYLIDGRPIANYPALYNGTDVITSLSGIPTTLVDSIDILPGGQSSIYGSDAIAGVINIKLKKKLEGFEVEGRYGWTGDGGGAGRRIGITGGSSWGPVSLVASAQYESTSPMWGYQRPLTRQYFANGPTPQTAERDSVVISSDGTTYYSPTDLGASCAPGAALFNGSLTQRTRPGHGDYCGTTNSGYYTINNGTESTQGYLRLSVDVTDNTQLFGEVLLNHDVQRFASGGNYFQPASDVTSPYYYYYDPTIGDEVNVQRLFSPEEAGGINNFLNKNTNNSVRGTVGVNGGIGSSAWKYLVDMTYTRNDLTERIRVGLTAGLNAYFAGIMGPALDPALNPFGDGDAVYSPNYAALFSPATPAQYAAFSGELANYSYTQETLARAEVTNSDLFKLPGGSAGLALLVEGGQEGWSYNPDPGFEDGSAYLYTSSVGGGHRSRMAETAELRLPVFPMLVLDLSGRYDDYSVASDHVKKGTYNLGVEFRPLKSLLVRGRYGTSFKVPTLSDEFQALSGFYQNVTDYYKCAQQGYSGATIGNCPQANAVTVFGTTEGNPALQPITAKNIDIGIVWSPLERAAFTIDFIHWKISNEVAEQDSDQLLRTESACQLGQLVITSPTCVQALAQVTRDSQGNLSTVNTPKINIASEALNVIALSANYVYSTPVAGDFTFSGAYSNTIKHDYTQFPGDAAINLLENPFYSTEFKTKENVSLGWDFHKFGTTLYVERYGKTGNYLSTLVPDAYATAGAARVNSWTIANLSAKYEVLPGLTVTAICDNLFNRMPPTDNSYPGTQGGSAYYAPYNSSNYNVYGRQFFVQANYKFGKN